MRGCERADKGRGGWWMQMMCMRGLGLTGVGYGRVDGPGAAMSLEPKHTDMPMNGNSDLPVNFRARAGLSSPALGSMMACVVRFIIKLNERARERRSDLLE